MDKPKRQPHEIAERAAEARSLLASDLVTEVFDGLRERYVQQLVQADVGSLTAHTLHARIQVLAAVRGELQSVVNDGLIQSKRR